MSAVIDLFLDICLFRKGPQDAPASTLLLAIAIVAYVLVGLVLFGIEVGPTQALLQIVVEGGALLGFTYLTLLASGYRNRILQTTIAMVGTDALISTSALPLVVVALYTQEGQIAYALLLALTLWHLAVIAHILRHALSRSYSHGLVLAIAYFLGTYYLMNLVIGPPQ